MVKWLEANEGYRPDIVVVLQPTSPLRTSEDIDASLALMDSKRGEAVVSVCPLPFPAEWLTTVDDQSRMAGWTFAGAAQDLYVPNGAVYASTRDVLLRTRDTYADPTWAYVMPRERSVDIDSMFDFELAEWLLTRNGSPL
jgi:CMP-N-acetylneuraminic acid synthetase